MNPYIEKAARAWREKRDEFTLMSHGTGRGSSTKRRVVLRIGEDTEETVFGPALAYECDRWLDYQCALAVLQSIAEPSEEMKFVGGIAIEDAMFAEGKFVFDGAGDAWQAMHRQLLHVPTSSPAPAPSSTAP